MRALGLVLSLVLCAAALAQQPKRPPRLEPLPEAPPPPSISGPDEPAVNIPIPQGHKVEELRLGGHLVALRVTPPGGKPYYGNRVPMYEIKTFD
jgi:hypothetical protein